MKNVVRAVIAIAMLVPLTTLGSQPSSAAACRIIYHPDGWKTIRPPSNEFEIHGQAIDPSNPRRIFIHDDKVVYRSDDGGCSWAESWTNTWVGVGPYTPEIRHIAVQGQRVYVLAYGLQRDDCPDCNPAFHVIYSDRGGAPASWKLSKGLPLAGSEIIDPPIKGIDIAPSNPRVLYIGFRGTAAPTSTIYRSSDGAETWERTEDPASLIERAQDPGMRNLGYSFVIDPSNPRTLWALGGPFSTEASQSLYRSKDAGATWDLVKVFPWQISHVRVGGNGKDAWVLAVSNQTPGFVRLYLSANSGQNFHAFHGPLRYESSLFNNVSTIVRDEVFFGYGGRTPAAVRIHLAKERWALVKDGNRFPTPGFDTGSISTSSNGSLLSLRTEMGIHQSKVKRVFGKGRLEPVTLRPCDENPKCV